MSSSKLEKQATSRPRARVDINAWAMAGVLAAMWAFLALSPATGGTFFTQGNLGTLLSQASVLLVVSVGMTLVILIRGIDLSVGAGVALTGVIAALLHTRFGLPVPIAMVLTIVAGAVLGAWHGAWAGWLSVPAFVVTLAGFKAYRGGALVMASSTTQPMDDFAFLRDTVSPCTTIALVGVVLAIGLALTFRDATRRRALGLDAVPTRVVALRAAGQVLLAVFVVALFGGTGAPMPVLVAAAVALAGVFLTKRTTFGRYLYAIGGNPEAARLSGIDVKKVTLGVYVILGVLVAVAGLLSGARTGCVAPGTQGHMLELDAVTAVVIGGTSISGGRGSIAGTVLGALVFATLANGMNLLRIDSNYQLIFTGAILLAAVLVDVVLKGRRS